MRRSIDELRTFYGEPTGALARRLVARRLDDAWGEATDCDVLGVGYATPWLDAFVGARRVVAMHGFARDFARILTGRGVEAEALAEDAERPAEDA